MLKPFDPLIFSDPPMLVIIKNPIISINKNDIFNEWFDEFHEKYPRIKNNLKIERVVIKNGKW